MRGWFKEKKEGTKRPVQAVIKEQQGNTYGIGIGGIFALALFSVLALLALLSLGSLFLLGLGGLGGLVLFGVLSGNVDLVDLLGDLVNGVNDVFLLGAHGESIGGGKNRENVVSIGKGGGKRKCGMRRGKKQKAKIPGLIDFRGCGGVDAF